MEVSAVQMLVKMINDRRYSASYIANEVGITLANTCKILDGYKPNFVTENAIRQLYKSLFENEQIKR